MQPAGSLKPTDQPADDSPGQIEPSAVAGQTANQPSTTAHQESPISAAPTDDAAGPEIAWTASEYIAHDKGVGWFLGLAGVVGLAAAAVYLVTGDAFTVAIVLTVSALFGAFALRKPRVLSYRIDHSGITIADKHYPYSSFGSFTVREEEAIDSILLVPLKRFMPALSVYFPPEQAERIIGTLGAYLPHEDRPPDIIDHLMRKIRF